ncbi:MAG: glutaredoxin [Thermoprotei archaeon]|nr:MAG: glutaredoxin [Thermoprotei archaeon]
MELEVDEETKKALREALKDMVNPVECMVFVTKDLECAYCETTVQLCKLLSETSNGKVVAKIFYEERNEDKKMFERYKVIRKPSILLYNGYIRYTGIPAGEELKGLIETLIRLSTGDPGLSNETIDALRSQLKGKAYIEVIVTLTCPYCPYAALEANMFAFASKGKIMTDIVEAMENPDIADYYGITVVPAIVINGNVEFIGVPKEKLLLKAVFRYQKDHIELPFHTFRRGLNFR